MRILAQTTCASSCERNWSTQKYLQGPLCASLHPKNFDKRVYVFSNIRLETKMKSGFVILEGEDFEDPDASDSESEDSASDCESELGSE